MQFDAILVHIGVYGKYQKVLCLLLYLVAIPMAWHAIAQVFLGAKTDHWCAVPSGQSLNCTDLEASATAACLEQQKELGIPTTVDKNGNVVYSNCERYETVWSQDDWGLINRTRDGENNQTVECDLGWEYNRTQYKRTIIQDFNLVCASENLPDLAQSIFFAGFLSGSFVWGAIADWAGRRFTFFVSLAIAAVTTTVVSFVPSFAAYTALRFIIAAADYGVYLMAFVLICEIVGPAYRTMVGTMLSVSFSIGYAFLAVLAYFIRDWRSLQLTIGLPWFFFFVFLLFLPESPRWLMSKRRFKEAEKVIEQIAKRNGTKVPDNLFDEEELPEKSKMPLTRQATQIDLFRTPNMCKKTLNLFYHWFVISLVYYGLSLSTSALGVDDYVAAFLSGAVELPAYLISWLSIEKVGRRLPLNLSLVSGGLACLITILFEPGVLRASIALFGKFAVSMSFNIIYIFSCELYPTPVRSMGVGMSSMSARLSGVLAPFILMLDGFWEPLPLIFFGGSAVIAGMLTLLLPETLNQSLPETIEQGEDFGKGQGLEFLTLFKLPPKNSSDNGIAAPDTTYKEIPKEDQVTNDNEHKV